MKCLMRVPGRRRLLYCKVATQELAQQLGKHLYEQVAAVGEATWIHRSWRIYEFTIQKFSQPKLCGVDDLIKELRDAGLKAWDKVSDPESYIRELRQ